MTQPVSAPKHNHAGANTLQGGRRPIPPVATPEPLTDARFCWRGQYGHGYAHALAFAWGASGCL